MIRSDITKVSNRQDLRLLRFSDELQPDSIVVATLYAVTDARHKPGAVIFRMQLNDLIFC